MKIEAENLSRHFRVGSSEVTAVSAVNLRITKPLFIAIVGPSGSGKSTLLNLLGLNDYPTSGRILIDNSDASQLTSGNRRKIRRCRMGFVFQTFNLLPMLNALENVELPVSFAGKPQKEQREKALKLLDEVGLTKRLQHRPKQLSMGEMQRVAIARALANDPEMIIADEPTGELDSRTAKEIINVLREINKTRKAGIIVATHDEKLVEVADTVYTMLDGSLNPQE